jgi:hypothetical protein
MAVNMNITNQHFEESSPIIDSFISGEPLQHFERENNSTFGARIPLNQSEISSKAHRYMRRYEKRHAHDDSFGCVDLSKATDLVKAALSKTGVLTDMTNIGIKSRSKRHY